MHYPSRLRPHVRESKANKPKRGAMRKMELVDRERYEILRKMLQDRAGELTDKLRSLRQTLPDELAEVKDPEEQCVHEFVRGLDFALIEMKSRTLERIHDALGRLEVGNYGLCADCDEPIAKARLQALPFAERCRDCQEGREEIAAEAARQQSRFGLPQMEEATEPAAKPVRPPREGRRVSDRPAARTGRTLRPGETALRRQLALMDRAAPRRVPPASTNARTARPARRTAATRASKSTARQA
jgi:DnaK suppressor protein